MDTLLLLAVLLGAGAGAALVVRDPSFWINFGKEIFKRLLPSILLILKNRPKSDTEWDEWRRLSSMNPSDMSPAESKRFKELKKLNAEFRRTL